MRAWLIMFKGERFQQRENGKSKKDTIFNPLHKEVFTQRAHIDSEHADTATKNRQHCVNSNIIHCVLAAVC